MAADRFESWTRALGQIGCTGDSARLDLVPQVCPLPLAPPRVTPPTSPEAGRLTTRELEVAVLASRGLKNRDIAADLVISERTVHAHIRSILNKLGLESRVQIATWLVAHQPTTSKRD